MFITPFIQNAKTYAISCHSSTNHFYNGLPYAIHLEHVVSVAERFIDLIPINDREDIIAACWCHDLIEDTRQTYNDVKDVVGNRVAEMVYACTNEKGRTRKERANDKFYDELFKNSDAIFVKLCDRIANIQYSISTKSSMLSAYQKESSNFHQKLYISEYEPMFAYIIELLHKIEQ